MSGFIGTAISSLSGLLASRYRAAQFRGAGFYVVEQGGETGRALGIHILPLRESHVVEDLGRNLGRFTITGYVIGEDYEAARDALIKACAGDDQAGTLILPTLGERQARCETLRYSENLKEGNFCALEMTFVEEGPTLRKVAGLSRLAQALRTVGAVLTVARRVYALYRAANGDIGGFLARAAGSYMAGLAGRLAGQWLGLPGLNLNGLRLAIGGLGGANGDDPTLTALAVTGPFQALAEAPVTLADPTIPAEAGAAQTVARSRPDAPVPGLLATLLLEQAAGPAQPDAPDTRAIADLARDAAAACAAQAVLEADWSNATEVLVARDALLDALRAREIAAADREADDLAAGFRALAADVQQDLSDRAARLPLRAPYSLPAGLPALALAQRLHTDAARADELVALNLPHHPAFMRREGWRLQP